MTNLKNAENEPQTMEAPKGKVVSVKLDNGVIKDIKRQAEENGTSVSEVVRQIMAKKSPTEPQANEPAAVQKEAVNLSEQSITQIAQLIELLTPSLPSSIEVNLPPQERPEREYLRKLAGLTPIGNQTLTNEEQTFLQELSEQVRADLRETFLLKENSVPMPLTENQLQKNMFAKMVNIRETMESEKVPTLQSVFQNAIGKAFFEDAERLYDRRLFKATYGFEYAEFKAVFDL